MGLGPVTQHLCAFPHPQAGAAVAPAQRDTRRVERPKGHPQRRRLWRPPGSLQLQRSTLSRLHPLTACRMLPLQPATLPCYQPLHSQLLRLRAGRTANFFYKEQIVNLLDLGVHPVFHDYPAVSAREQPRATERRSMAASHHDFTGRQ